MSAQAFALADISLLQGVAVAATAFFAATIGGMAGYGTGLLLPLVLVPIIGAENVVPVIAVSSVFTNVGRIAAMIRDVSWPTFRLMLPAAIPCAALTAYGYSALNGPQASLVIGLALLVLVPLRRILHSAGFVLQGWQLVPAGGIYGLVNGGTAGAGVILISFLMASGLVGQAVIATDAAISIVLTAVKATTFYANDALPLPLLAFAILVGLATVPGGQMAKFLLERLPLRLHTLMLEAVIVIGGAGLVWQGLKQG